MGERFILGIDIGTTSVKTILISSEGFIADETTQNHDLLSLFPGWAEEEADQWWQDTVDSVRTLVERNPAKLDKIAGIGVSGMVPAIVMLGIIAGLSAAHVDEGLVALFVRKLL